LEIAIDLQCTMQSEGTENLTGTERQETTTNLIKTKRKQCQHKIMFRHPPTNASRYRNTTERSATTFIHAGLLTAEKIEATELMPQQRTITSQTIEQASKVRTRIEDRQTTKHNPHDDQSSVRMRDLRSLTNDKRNNKSKSFNSSTAQQIRACW